MVDSAPNNSCKVTAILLVGGSSKRFGPDNKLLAMRNDKPLIDHALDSITGSQIQHLIVVLGHDAPKVAERCKEYFCNANQTAAPAPSRGSRPITRRDTVQTKTQITGQIEQITNPINVEFVLNSDYESGMASSLRAGISALVARNNDNIDAKPHAALVCLGDMPVINPETLDMLIQATKQTTNEFVDHITASKSGTASAFVPTHENVRGNPVLLMPQLFDSLLDVAGDVGARHLLRANPDAVREVPVNDAGIFNDCDFPEQLAP